MMLVNIAEISFKQNVSARLAAFHIAQRLHYDARPRVKPSPHYIARAKNLRRDKERYLINDSR